MTGGGQGRVAGLVGRMDLWSKEFSGVNMNILH